MPLRLATLFRIAVACVLALHVFYMYSLARAMQQVVGFHLSTAIVSGLFAMVMLIPLVWAVTLPELPEIYTRHYRARRWFAAGRCPACGYSLAGAERQCAECGRVVTPPTPYAISGHTLRLFVLINLLAWAGGSLAGELWALDDERQFRREVQLRQQDGRDGEFTRPRRWPGDSGRLIYQPDRGIVAN